MDRTRFADGDPLARAIDELDSRGFTNVGAVVDESTVRDLRAGSASLAQAAPTPWSASGAWFHTGRWNPTYFAEPGRNRTYYDCLGVDPLVDAAVEALLETPHVARLLTRALGEDHRLWYAQFRWAEPGAEEYVLHQDVYGELALCLLLDDHPDDRGSTVFWPGSHRFPRAIEALPQLAPRWVRNRLRGLRGVRGEMCAFLNKTWHGRTSARGGSRLVFLITFTPPGPHELPRRLPRVVRDRLGPRLRAVTDPDAGRSRGERLPPDLPFTASFEHRARPDSACTFADRGERAIAEYALAVCRAIRAEDPRSFSVDEWTDRLVEVSNAWQFPEGFSVDRVIESFREQCSAPA